MYRGEYSRHIGWKALEIFVVWPNNEDLKGLPTNVTAVFSPVHKRILMLGDNLPPGTILSFKPDEGTFEKVTTGGSVPPKMQSMNLMAGPDPHQVTLAGIFLEKGYAYILNLETMEWSRPLHCFEVQNVGITLFQEDTSECDLVGIRSSH